MRQWLLRANKQCTAGEAALSHFRLQAYSHLLGSLCTLCTPVSHQVLKMRLRGMEVFDKHFSFFRNPAGVASSMLFEAWVMLQQFDIIKGPHGL